MPTTPLPRFTSPHGKIFIKAKIFDNDGAECLKLAATINSISHELIHWLTSQARKNRIKTKVSNFKTREAGNYLKLCSSGRYEI